MDCREEESCVHVAREEGEAGWLAGLLGMLGLLFPVAAPLQLPILQEWLGKEIFDDNYGAFIL